MSCATDFRKVSKRERETDFEVTSDNEQVTASCATEFRKVSKRERERERERETDSVSTWTVNQ